MNWQNIVVYIIGAVVFAWLLRAIVRGYRARKYSKCSSCEDSSCPYHNSTKKRRVSKINGHPFYYITISISICAVRPLRNITTG